MMNVDILPPSGGTGTAGMEPKGRKEGINNVTTTMFLMNVYYVQTTLKIGAHLILITTIR